MNKRHHPLNGWSHHPSVWNTVLQRKTARLFHGGRFYTTEPEDQPRRPSKNSQGHSEPGFLRHSVAAGERLKRWHRWGGGARGKQG